MSWRDHIKVHPAADLFPMMEEPELRLGEDIETQGLKSHLKLHKGKLLDGRNRLEAMELAGVQVNWSDDVAALGCPFDHLDERVDPYNYVISANLHRRHLTGEQKRGLIKKVLKAKPQASNRKIAQQAKADHKTVAAVRNDMESTGEIPQLDKTEGKDGKKRGLPPKRKVGLSQPRPPQPEPEPAGATRAAGSATVDIEERRAQMAALDPEAAVEPDLSIPPFLDRTNDEAAQDTTPAPETQAQIDSRLALDDFKIACKICLPKLTDEDWLSAVKFFDKFKLGGRLDTVEAA